MKKKHFSLLRRARRHDAPDTAAIMEVQRKNILSEKSDFFIRESYKTLRTNVTFSLADETACKVLIVTSAMQSEGKSITALNLAISYAEMKQRVLLIDCDLRRPKLARLLSAKEKVGLSNLLIQPELLGKAIHDSGIEDLDVIFAGDVPPNPSELLGSSRMKALLDSLQENYDYIILDTSPVNLVTDACVLVPESSGVLFVVRAGLSERGSVLRAVEQLERSHAKILGFVLNEVTRESGYYGYRKYGYQRHRYGYGRGYGYGYGHGYGYGYGQEKPDSMTDLHTHILPRMDDGAPDTAASLAMLRMEAAQGVTGVALTPHFHRDRESIEQFLARRQAAWEHLSAAMKKTAEPFPDLVLGAEVAWMPNMNHWDDLEALCLGSSRYLLLELPFTLWNNSMIDQLYSLAAQSGVTPVLAHLERYLGRQKKEHIQELYRLNVPIQLSAGCLLHPIERWKLLRLLREGQSFFLASDCHGTQRRTPDLGPAAAVAKKRLTGDALEALLCRSDAIFTAARAEQEREYAKK